MEIDETNIEQIKEKEETTKEEPKDLIYRLEERADEMDKAASNYEKIIAEQNHIIDTLKIIKNDEAITNLIDALDEQSKQLQNQVNILKARHLKIIDVCKAANNNNELKESVTQLLLALGVFEA